MEQWQRFQDYWRGMDPRRRLVAWATLVGLAVGVLQLNVPVENVLQSVRNGAFSRPASGKIVIVGIDDKSLEQVGQWPWARASYARLLSKLEAAKPNHVYFDLAFRSPSSEYQDAELERSLLHARGRVSLVTVKNIDSGTGRDSEAWPLRRFSKNADVVDGFLTTNFLNQADRVPTVRWANRQLVPSLSYAMSGKPKVDEPTYPISYTINPHSIPYVSASDILAGRVPASQLEGRQLIVGVAASTLGDLMTSAGHGRMSAVFVHAIAAETLLRGTPRELGWLSPLLLAVVAALAFVTATKRAVVHLMLTLFVLLLVFAPLILEYANVFIHTVPALVMIAITCIGYGRQQSRRQSEAQSFEHDVSGLANFKALRQRGDSEDGGLVVARIGNYADVVASLREHDEEALAEQIVSRLAIGGASEVFHGEEGLFAWFAPTKDLGGIGGQLEALHALFRGAFHVGERPIDLALSFGVVAPDGRSIANRLSSALVAATEAAEQGLRWKAFDPSQLLDAEWRLSLLGQLDAAIGRGDIWVAYQPKLDLASGEIVGAEALVRWSHPEKGPISPDEFIRAAEQHGRIDRLTDFVLESAIRSAAGVNAIGIAFGVAVNLSTSSLIDDSIVNRVQTLLNRYRLPAERLTLEVTESAELIDSATAMSVLNRLREIGVKLSIDDYGTGHSTLDYLRIIPANEVKIDRGFVRNVVGGEADRLLVASTIELAHSLGRSVVAEGVEDEATLALLRDLGCDVIQGYHIGRPVKLVELIQRLTAVTRSDVPYRRLMVVNQS